MASHSVANAAISTLKMYTQVTPSLRAQSKKPRRHSRECSQRSGAGKGVIKSYSVIKHGERRRGLARGSLGSLRNIVASAKPPAQGGHQVGMGRQTRGLHLLLDLLLAEQQGLGVQHIEVVREAALVGDHRDVVGFLRRGPVAYPWIRDGSTGR